MHMGGWSVTALRRGRYQGRRNLADQRQYSGISASQSLQPRDEAAAQAAAAQKADQQADGRGRPRRHDADSAKALFQRTRPRQALARGGEGQEVARQARKREEARLGQGERPPAAGAGIEVSLMYIRLCEPTGRPKGPPDDGLREAIQHLGPQQLDCFVASAPLRQRFAFVAGNDDRWRIAR